MLNDKLDKISPAKQIFPLADSEKLKLKIPRLKNLYNFLSEVAKSSFNDTFLLSNSVLSKSDLSLPALDRYIGKKDYGSISFFFSLKKIFMYFSKSFGWLLIFLAQKFAHKISRQKFTPSPDKPITIIDIYLNPKDIVRNGNLNDRFFPGLEKILVSRGLNYAYTPKLSGGENPWLYFKMFFLLKKINRPVLFSFQLLETSDFLKMLGFIFIYPLKLIRKIKALNDTYNHKFLRFFLWNTFDHTTVKSYMRQLFGNRISGLDIPAGKCISWYENQAQDKNFYKGIRSNHRKFQIYGAQLYLWPGTLLNLHADEQEIDFEVTPDRILVNGPYYLKKDSPLKFEVGPSMRYFRLFQTTLNVKDKTDLLILLPVFEYEIDRILQMVEEAQLSATLYVKFHPDTNKNKYAHKLQGKMQIVNEDIYFLFERVCCVIGKSTGALLEATSLGIPVINAETGSGISHNYLPEFGRGIIWENASNGAEIVKWANIFKNLVIDQPELIYSVAEKHKEMFFCEPTDKRIEEAFDLANPNC
tara:strand:- start:178 stop:1764 length:1587 start_codon:yes stop_codon:yes gene_type:complete